MDTNSECLRSSKKASGMEKNWEEWYQGQKDSRGWILQRLDFIPRMGVEPLVTSSQE